MPAMSPTMTEGNISKWRFKEGDSYSAGDVLLDIETDKAQMDVEAQDDGVLAKVVQPDGTKSIKVGTRIAVIAEPGDDLQSLEIPPDESPTASSPGESGTEAASQQGSTSRPEEESAKPADKTSRTTTSSADSSSEQKYPLYPSVQALLHEVGLSEQDVPKIPASGPNGRLLKGDVLSFSGKIEKSYSTDQSNRITKLGHLDLSNVKRAEAKPKPKPVKTSTDVTAPKPEPDTQIAVTISLSAVLLTQKRIKDTLGLTLPLSTFIARASELANEELPRRSGTPSAEELYDAVLGLDKISKTSRGSYAPQITNLNGDGRSERNNASAQVPRKQDVYDVLTGRKSSKAKRVNGRETLAADAVSPDITNVFSLSAKKGEEKRVRTYLERVKTVLEAEPGRLVL